MLSSGNVVGTNPFSNAGAERSMSNLVFSFDIMVWRIMFNTLCAIFNTADMVLLGVVINNVSSIASLLVI